jgi:hypothetical protein
LFRKIEVSHAAYVWVQFGNFKLTMTHTNNGNYAKDDYFALLAT